MRVLLWALVGAMEAAAWQAGAYETNIFEKPGPSVVTEDPTEDPIEPPHVSDPAQLHALALQMQSAGRYREAESLYRQALEACGSGAAAQAAITRGNLGGLLILLGRYAEAEPLLLHCLRDAEASTGPDSMEAGSAALHLAALYRAWNQAPQAEPFAQRAARIFDHHPEEAAGERRITDLMFASIDVDLGRYREAETLLSSPEDPADTATHSVTSYNDRAVTALKQGRLAEAEQFLRRAFRLAEGEAGISDSLRATLSNNFAQIRRFQGRYLDAEKYYRRAIDLWKNALGPQHPNVAKGFMNLAAFYHERGRESGAEDLYRRAASLLESSYTREDPLFLVARNELADVLRAQRRFTESEKLALATIPPLEKSVGSKDARFLRALENYARLLDDAKRPQDAAAVRKRAKALQTPGLPAE
ncbi:MAG: tetratricopeptide repeat protein [Acidobacteriia bacterium]|nr:tetratricopeptide repeat protein [Terriglobia bacterium]